MCAYSSQCMRLVLSMVWVGVLVVLSILLIVQSLRTYVCGVYVVHNIASYDLIYFLVGIGNIGRSYLP